MERVVNKVISDSLKKSNESSKFIMSTLPYVAKAVLYADKFSQLDSLTAEQKLEFGLYLREAGSHWNSVFLLAIAQEYFNQHYQSVDPASASSDFDIDHKLMEPLLAKYAHLNDLIAHERLSGVHQTKPLLDGKQICELYSIKPGKAIKGIMDEELQYQILNPQA